MKKIGSIRHIDDLGRIVIPSDIRQQFKVSPGDAFEFFVEKEKIVLIKQQLFEEKEEHLYAICEILSEELATKVYFYYDDKFIDPTNEIEKNNYQMTTAFKQLLLSDTQQSFNETQMFVESDELAAGMIYPIIKDKYTVGVFVIFKQLAKLDEKMLFALDLYKQLLIKQL